MRLAAHMSTRVSDDALETGKTGAVSCEPNDKYEDLKTQLLKFINVNVGKTRINHPTISPIGGINHSSIP